MFWSMLHSKLEAGIGWYSNYIYLVYMEINRIVIQSNNNKNNMY